MRGVFQKRSGVRLFVSVLSTMIHSLGFLGRKQAGYSHRTVPVPVGTSARNWNCDRLNTRPSLHLIRSIPPYLTQTCSLFVVVAKAAQASLEIMSRSQNHSGQPQLYQIDFTAVASGKRIASSKRRIRW